MLFFSQMSCLTAYYGFIAENEELIFPHPPKCVSGETVLMCSLGMNVLDRIFTTECSIAAAITNTKMAPRCIILLGTHPQLQQKEDIKA